MKRILILSPEEKDSRISSRESKQRMLKPEFLNKDRKGRNEKKEKERKDSRSKIGRK